MLPFRKCQAILLGVLLLTGSAFAARTRRATIHRRVRHHYVHHRYRHYYHHYIRGQRGIEPQRAQQIQDALIKAHYLSGPASGHWDASTQAAMEKFQADHGWQTKLVPDSRALIALGLGPRDDKPAAVAAPPSDPLPPATETASDPNPTPGTLAEADSLRN